MATAGWELKIKQRQPEWLASNGVTIELSRYEEASGGTSLEAWFGPPDERGTSVFRTPEKPDAWHADRRTLITATAPTVVRACAMLAEAVRRYEAGWKRCPSSFCTGARSASLSADDAVRTDLPGRAQNRDGHPAGSQYLPY